VAIVSDESLDMEQAHIVSYTEVTKTRPWWAWEKSGRFPCRDSNQVQ